MATPLAQEQTEIPPVTANKPDSTDSTPAVNGQAEDKASPAVPVKRPVELTNIQNKNNNKAKLDANWRQIQIAAFQEQDKADTAAALLSQKHKTRLNGHILSATIIQKADGGQFWRVMSEAMPAAEANAICDALKKPGRIVSAENTRGTVMSDALTDTEFQQSAETDKEAEQLSLFVNLDGFEGPIDLLLSLAREQKVDLAKSLSCRWPSNIWPILLRQKLNLEVAADYLVMAAWLAFLKSRLLLPDPEPEQADDVIDMTDALRFQLVRLEAMQNASKKLASLQILGRQRLVRGQPEEFEGRVAIVWQARLFDLIKAYGDIRSAEEAQMLTIAATRLYSVQEAAARLSRLLPKTPGWTQLEHFLPPELKDPLDRRSAMASHFVASLELAKDGQITCGNLEIIPRFT